VESIFADAARIILPVHAVLETADSTNQIVVFFALLTELIVVLKASIDDAGSSFEFVMGLAFNANPSVILEASFLHLLA
jgi:hypothetical protein